MDWKGFDALMPAQMARKAEDVGVAKAALPTMTLLLLGVLAGAFISLGALFSMVSVLPEPVALPFGLARVLGGLTFSLGLILVVVAGAELFTGNNLIVMAWANGRVPSGQLLRNWVVVYLGNLLGALATAVLVFLTDLHLLSAGKLGNAAISIATMKCELALVPAFTRGILCNALVCLAVWLSFSARTTTDRILAVVPPITAFVACGFEHCVANMFFVPYGMLVDTAVADAVNIGIRMTPASDSLGLAGFIANLLPVTLGNIVGGAGLVGAIYWFVYLRGQTAD